MNIPFSVSMCVYAKDNPLWFREAVDSVLNQTLRPSELVLVVDGPLPETLEAEVLALSSNPLVKIVRFSENRGHGAARREGLLRCTHNWIAIMDADDVSVSNRFEMQIRYIANHPEVAVVGGQIEEFIDSPEKVVSKRTVPQNDVQIKEFLKTRCPFNQVTVMLNKDTIQRAGGYLDWYCDEDYYLWCRLYLQGAIFANLAETLVFVRINDKFYNRRGGWRYFKSEAALQAFMYKNRIINFGTFILNALKRLIVQVVLPNSIRGFLFKKLARE